MKRLFAVLLSVLSNVTASATESPNKLIIVNFVIATALNEHVMASDCRQQINGRAPDWSRLNDAVALGKPYMTSAELADYRSGKMLSEMKQVAAAAFSEMMNKQLANFQGNTRERCFFILGYAGGQKIAARDLLINLGVIKQ